MSAGTVANAAAGLGIRGAHADVNTPDAVPSANGAEKVYKGGPHRETSKPKNDGLDSHHLIADSVTSWSKGEGPAIQMDTRDHKLTKSNGRGSDAKAYRAQQKALFDEGKYIEAFEMDVKDIQSKFGDKYNDAINQAREYLIENFY